MENQQNNKTFVFGANTEKTPETITEKTDISTEVVDANIQNTQKETIVHNENIADKTISNDLNKEIPIVDNEAKKPVTIDFKNHSKTDKNTENQQKETSEISEQSVLKWLNEQGIKADKISDLSKKEELADSVSQFNKFVKETGRTSLKDFYNAQKDWSKESKDNTIKEFYKYNYKNISDEDIEDRIDLLRVTEDDEENLGDRELRQRRLDYNSEYAKALEFMNKTTKDYNTPLDSTVQQKQPTTEEIAEAYRPYWDARDKSLAKLTDVEFKVEGIGDIKLNVTNEHKQLISEITQTTDSFINRWASEDGKIDTDRSAEDTMWSIPSIRNEFIASMMEQAQALVLENFSKEKRNVNLHEKQKELINPKGGGFQIIGDKQSSNSGKPLI